MDITLRKLTPESAADFIRFFEEVAFTDHPEWGGGCYCCFFHAASAAQWDAACREGKNRETALELIMAGQMKGLLAYDGGLPVGWCHFDGRSSFPGLPVFMPQVLDDAGGIGAIVCFTVAQGWRRKGIAGALLEGACRTLEEEGFAIAEAYPFLDDDSDEHNYHGPLSLYLRHGFSVHRRLQKEAVVRRALTDGTSRPSAKEAPEEG